MSSSKNERAEVRQGRAPTPRTSSWRPWRWLSLVVIVFVGAGLSWSEPAEGEPCWSPPVEGVVTDPFRKPPCPWCPGNRGIEYRVGGSTTVHSTATGRVVFSGRVVDTTYVVVRLANGWRLTYGKLDDTHLEQGDVVVAGSVIGRSSGEFFFGIRDGDVYIDPAPYLGRLFGQPRLIPSDGSAGRPSMTSRLRCQAGAHSVNQGQRPDSIDGVDSPGSSAVRSETS